MRSALCPPQVGRLPAGALLLVVTVSVIITAVLLALILLVSNRRLLVERDTLRQQLRRNLYSGLAYAQAHPDLPAFRPLGVDLFGEGGDSVQIVRKPWGVFDVAVLTATKGPFRDTAVALLGSTFGPVNRAALYLTDERVPLSINEDAQVQGGAWLPQAEGIRPANLPLVGSRRTGAAVMGPVHISQSTLPIASDSTLGRLKEYANLHLASLLPAGSSPQAELARARNSFQGLPAVWYHNGPFTVQGTLDGQVVIASSQRLIVSASSQLDNVLLLAPTILVEAGFRGRVQLIARDTVAVGDNCSLDYPSAVCAYGASKTTLVSVGAGSRIQGAVIAAAAEPGLGCRVLLTPATIIEGQIFSAGVVENCGTVHGTVMCRRLVYKGVGSFYENYLVNSILSRTALSPHFLTTRLLNRAAGIGVVTWLH